MTAVTIMQHGDDIEIERVVVDVTVAVVALVTVSVVVATIVMTMAD